MTELLVFTFKEGLLSRVAHDLKIVVEKVEVVRNGGSLTVTIAANSLRVRCAMRGGREDHNALSASNRREIEGIIAEKILESTRHPTVCYTGEIRGNAVIGTLTMRGIKQPVVLPWKASGASIIGEVTLDQRRFGIQPYRAMMGTLKLKPELKVAWRVEG